MSHLPSPPVPASGSIPVWTLYGEDGALPDVLHVERITDRAAGLDWRIAPHRHLHLHQFFLINDGLTRVTLDGATPEAEAPFVLSIPPGVVHGFTFSADIDGFVLTVPVQSLPGQLGTAAARDGLFKRACVLPVEPGLTALFLQVHQEHQENKPSRNVMLHALSTQIGCLVLRAMDQDQPGYSAATDPRFHAFTSLLQLHLRDRWSMADYARAVGVSDRHLSRITRKATGQSVAGLIESALMREACRLLVYTPAPIASIGYDLGFDDPSYFSRAFRRATGLSPGAYRAGFERS